VAKKKFIVAIKNSATDKEIKPGKTLGKFREKEFADHAFPGLVRKSGLRSWEVGIFQDEKLIN